MIRPPLCQRRLSSLQTSRESPPLRGELLVGDVCPVEIRGLVEPHGGCHPYLRVVVSLRTLARQPFEANGGAEPVVPVGAVGAVAGDWGGH